MSAILFKKRLNIDFGDYLKKTVCLILIILLVINLSACFNFSEGKTLYVPIDEEPISLDPQIAFGYGDEIIARNCFEGLLRIDSKGNVDFGVAFEYKVSSNGLKYTFSLNPNACWHLTPEHKTVLTGDSLQDFDTRVRSEDFVFAIRRALVPETKAAYAENLFCIKNAKKVHDGTLAPENLGVKAIDDRTLEITLEYEDTSFLYTLASPIAMPCNKEFFEKTKGKYGLELDYTLCNGPLYVTSWTHGSSVFIRMNKDYKGKATVNASLIGLMINKDKANRLSLLLSGSYDCDFIEAKAVSEISDTSSLKLQRLQNSVWGLMINANNNSNLQDINLRKALFYSFDTAVIDSPPYIGERTDSVVPAGCLIGNELYSQIKPSRDKPLYSEAEAKLHFGKAIEKTEGRKISITITCPRDFRKSIERVIQNWQSVLGINLSIKLNEVSDEQLLDLIEKKSYEAAFLPVESDGSLANEYINKLCIGTIAYKNKTLNSLLLQEKKQTNAAKKASIISQIETHLHSNAVFYPVFNAHTYFASYINTEGIYYYSSKNNLCLYSGERNE